MIDVMILAAGLGTRMKSKRAKVLHELAGRPLISHVTRAALGLDPRQLIVIVGHGADEVERTVRDEVSLWAEKGGAYPELHFALQKEQKGTGHAVLAARELLSRDEGELLVMAGDGPMIKTQTLWDLALTHRSDANESTVLTVHLDDPTGYGRIIRDSEGRYVRSVEQKDASPSELAIPEVGVSIYCFQKASLLEALGQLRTDNAQGEYYLTDVPYVMARGKKRVGITLHTDAEEVMGVNTRIDLAELELKLRARKIRELMLGGVTIIDPATTYVHSEVQIGQDTIIHPQVVIEGRSQIGSDCVIRSWTRLKNVTAGDGVTIGNSCVIEDSQIQTGASVGPFARLRMGANIGEESVIGNFVEVKKSDIGRKTKAQHLSYLGDATIGNGVNIGAGTITCNYDGQRKHQTTIEDGVKIGSNTMLVAPVTVGRGSVTGAGAVVTKDLPPDSLAFGVPAVVKKRLK
jgi:bifunctional UDP-N-acetylglucosamine pyrophosphorylase/glucosamine-1-phosphate N-acetyltransferase